jgi:hypothetical protein
LFKILIIAAVILFLLVRLSAYALRILTFISGSRPRPENKTSFRKSRTRDLGGEYVDYEEVK